MYANNKKWVTRSFVAIFIFTVSLTGAVAHETKDTLEKSKPVVQEGNTQRVMAHPIDFSLAVNGETFSFQATIAEDIPSALTIGNEGASYAYRLEVRSAAEGRTPSGVNFLPTQVRIYLEEFGSRTLLKEVSMGLEVGGSGTMEMGAEDYHIVLGATVGDSSAHWVSEGKISQAEKCFNSPPNIFDDSGRLPVRDGLDKFKSEHPDASTASTDFGSSVEHAGVPPECCHMHCGANWFTCCGVISCCECQCCYPP